MVLKIIGTLILIWLAFMLVGFVVKAIGTLIIIAALVTVGTIAYAAIRGGRSGQRQIRP